LGAEEGSTLNSELVAVFVRNEQAELWYEPYILRRRFIFHTPSSLWYYWHTEAL